MNNRNLIVIGGSSGATGPLGRLLSDLSPDVPVAVVVVLHTAPSGPGVYSTVARLVGRRPVRTAEDGMRIEPGNVYIGVPNRHLLIEDDRLRLGFGPRENLSRPAIDPLFRSAALHYGPRAIGVILSGYLSDGAAGLAAIKSCGGIAVVQDPADAEVDQMPRHAKDAVAAAFTAPASQLGQLLSELVQEPPGSPLPPSPDLELEVEIALGPAAHGPEISDIADPVALSCPSCGGVLSGLRSSPPLRFRCQVGHAFTADVLMRKQEDQVDEALRTALRVLQERWELLLRSAADVRRRGQAALADLYEARAAEYRKHSDQIRRVMLSSMQRQPSED